MEGNWNKKRFEYSNADVFAIFFVGLIVGIIITSLIFYLWKM